MANAAGGPELASTPIARGSCGTAVVCLPTVVGTASVAQYLRFAAFLNGKRDVWYTPLSGFRDGQKLPVKIDEATDQVADLVIASIGDRPFCLLGHSAGGVIAWALAERMLARGIAPSGVVLLDTFFAGDDLTRQQSIELAQGMRALATEHTGNQEMFVPAALTAMGRYFALIKSYTPANLSLPGLSVRCETPLGGGSANTSGVAEELCSDHVVIPGDHFSIINKHAADAAGVVDNWIVELERKGNPKR